MQNLRHHVAGILHSILRTTHQQCCCARSIAAATGARDSYSVRLLPAFTTEEAKELLARHTYFRHNPTANATEEPPADAVADMKASFASTFTFLVGALGKRARALAHSIDRLPERLTPDSQLLHKGVPIPGACVQPAAQPAAHPSCCVGITRWYRHNDGVIAESVMKLLPKTLPAKVADVLAKTTSANSPGAAAGHAHPAEARVDGEALEEWRTVTL